ncbi:MAG: hypothetical protein HYZ37_11360 [Candidatus Solibacter usitatus]|nr:hypothetical protein [Candidatus Solibacter usitatus]
MAADPECIESHSFSMSMECHYQVFVPTGAPKLMFLVLHGYAMDASTMLRLALIVLGKDHLVVSIQAPNQFQLEMGSREIVYNWGTRAHGDASIRLHHNMVRHVRGEMEQRFGIPPSKTVLLGYSQPVGYNYRFAATFPEEVGGVIGICGGVPKNWETGDYGQVSASLLHIARDEDEFFPPAVTQDYRRKLRTRANEVEFHLLKGGHRFPSKCGVVIQPWLNRHNLAGV